MEYTQSFLATWHIYPKRNGQKRGKMPSFKIWEKMELDDQRAAYQDIKRRNAAGGWEFVRDMERYLKHRAWEDEWKGQTINSDPNDLILNSRVDLEAISDFGVQKKDLCEHQIMSTWSYFGSEPGDWQGAIVPECQHCEKPETRILTRDM